MLANIDSNGVLATHLEERWVEGLNFILSTEVQSDLFDFMFYIAIYNRSAANFYAGIRLLDFR